MKYTDSNKSENCMGGQFIVKLVTGSFEGAHKFKLELEFKLKNENLDELPKSWFK